MKRLFVLSVKYIPTIQLVGMLINNTLYTFDILLPITYLLDFLIGGSLVYIILGYICSITFGFCNWHRIIIAANLANSIIANIAIHANLPVTDIELLSSYYVVAGVFILLATRSHVKETKRNDERKD